VGPEALAGGPIGKVRDGDVVEIEVDRATLAGRVDVVETVDGDELRTRALHPELAVDEGVPDDTRLWAALQQVGGGTWGGCVYDVDQIIKVLRAGLAVTQRQDRTP
jgi:dihydroxyacid dehydratase/phosphogluconate dehydratase